MNTTSRPQGTPGSQATGHTARPSPSPSTSGRENSGLMFFFIGAAAVALLIVLGFNMLGPEGAARTGVGDGPAQSPAGTTTGGPDPGITTRDTGGISGHAAGTSPAGASTGGAAGAGGGTTTAVVPSAADTPTTPGREAVGAPVGGAPQATPGGGSGTSGGAITGNPGATGAPPVPTGVSPDAPAALPAAPPASR